MVELGKRKVEPIIKELDARGAQVVSISRLNTLADDGCLYEAYLTYLLHQKGEDGIYGALGDAVHNKLQAIMDGEATPDCLLPTLLSTYERLKMLGIDFPKDSRGGDAIRDSWMADMTHFCTSFVPPRGKFKTEQFCLLKVRDDLYLQGYEDLKKYNDDGSISIYDWKTSTNFKDKDLIHHGRQPICYAMAEEQAGNIVKEIAWIMLKYLEVSFIGRVRSNSKELSTINKVINRGKLITELSPHIKRMLLEGFDELTADVYLEQALVSNDLTVLPNEVSAQFRTKPYVRKYPLTDELRAEALVYIEKNAAVFKNKSRDPKDWPHRPFFKYGRGGKKTEDVFYCRSLCNHRNTCKHIKRYSEQMTLAPGAGGEDFSNLF